ncbi:E3 ubiquitin-protein ligase MYLIP-like isoform X1 [Biomphalaria glabrata]|uniref:E3 ubiquitin-protein ligase MYLIP-like isoform X1 n=1 Tax=Biomphalaria glabrata TaxID=6526 RepID=A0A9U8DWW2_BIOGL|nr:E3 ubiquitin-protein ligase MYLIP-like isoform X1 [Biomphalaria glabrata]
MLCYISQPNRQWVEIYIDPKQSAKVVLDKVLNQLNILESDYFGLQYTGLKNEALWLNLRNRVCDHEILKASNVYRFNLRVKFLVPPELIQQECTKELFYTQVKDEMSKGLITLTEPECDKETLAKIVACISQADFGDQTCNEYQSTIYHNVVKEICPHYGELDKDILDKIFLEHSKLHGSPRASAKYWMLRYASALPGYGVELHRAVTNSGEDVLFKVGPEGIIVQDCATNAVKNRFPYPQIRLATHNEKTVHIELMNDAGETEKEESYKLISRRAAVALYRCITEMHSFFRCATVCDDVQSQYSRDFKGTVVSIFNENSDLGKRYVFDIERTSKQAYDFVKRKLFHSQSSPASSPIHCSMTLDCDNRLERSENLSDHEGQDNDVKILKRKLESVKDSLLCCICMDNMVCMVLCPCGHMTCDSCSECIEKCPQCRSDVERFQKVFQNFGLDLRKEGITNCV